MLRENPLLSSWKSLRTLRAQPAGLPCAEAGIYNPPPSQPRVHAVFPGTARHIVPMSFGRASVVRQALRKCAHGVTVRVGVAEEDFEGAVHKRMKDEL